MRFAALLLGTSFLAACQGAGPQTISANPIPAGGGTGTVHTFANPTESKTYTGIGASHTYQYSVQVVNNVDPVTSAVSYQPVSAQNGQLYQGNASTARNSGFSVSYNPRDAIFDISLSDSKSGLSFAKRYQDPVHRTAFGGALEPQASTPNLTLPGIQYLQASDTSNLGLVGTTLQPQTLVNAVDGSVLTAASGTYQQHTFFYQKPGTTTKYVTLAGYLRNDINVSSTSTTTGERTIAYKLDRATWAFGEQTPTNLVPKTGTGTFTGNMLGSMIYNNLLDTDPFAPSYFQWIEGSATTSFDFGASTFTIGLTGKTFAPQLDGLTTGTSTIATGAAFNANGKGRIDLINSGGFLGQFNQAWFVNPNGTRYDLVIAGSSVDGAFYGPAAEEVGGSYRIVGGTPDERIDILGAFIGKK